MSTVLEIEIETSFSVKYGYHLKQEKVEFG